MPGISCFVDDRGGLIYSSSIDKERDINSSSPMILKKIDFLVVVSIVK